LDFRHELRNLERMHRLAADLRGARVPRPYPELSGSRLITLELLRGVPFSELLRLARINAASRIDALGLDRDLLAERLIETVLDQIFRLQVFQADTHPGNLLALPDNIIGFVDFGLVDTLDPVLRDDLLVLVRAAYNGDVNGVLRGLGGILVASDNADPAAFRRDFLEQTRRWRGGTAAEDDSLDAQQRSPIAEIMIAVLRSARQHGFRLPTNVLSVYRALLTAETVAHQIGARVSLVSVGRRFFRRLEAERLRGLLEPGETQAQLLDLVELLRTGPGNLERLLSDVADDRFVLRVESVDSVDDRRLADTRARLIALSVASVGLAVLLPASQAINLGGVPLQILLALVLGGVYARVVVLWRQLR
jgi:ubiquinone biosynthesis protein